MGFFRKLFGEIDRKLFGEIEFDNKLTEKSSVENPVLEYSVIEETPDLESRLPQAIRRTSPLDEDEARYETRSTVSQVVQGSNSVYVELENGVYGYEENDAGTEVRDDIILLSDIAALKSAREQGLEVILRGEILDPIEYDLKADFYGIKFDDIEVLGQER